MCPGQLKTQTEQKEITTKGACRVNPHPQRRGRSQLEERH